GISCRSPDWTASGCFTLGCPSVAYAGPLTYKAIEAEVHAQGVNFCFLGRVRSLASHLALRRALLGIMIARSFRKTVEREVRAIYKAAIISSEQEISQHMLGLFQQHMLYKDD